MESWKVVELSPSHAYLLMLVIESPGVQPSCLAEELQLTPSTITRLIEKLEEKELVVRRIDGKWTNVFPTEKGLEIQPKLRECLTEFYQIYCDKLGKEESDLLVQSINRIADKLPA